MLRFIFLTTFLGGDQKNFEHKHDGRQKKETAQIMQHREVTGIYGAHGNEVQMSLIKRH